MSTTIPEGFPTSWKWHSLPLGVAAAVAPPEAAFDGTLIEDGHFLANPARVALVPEVQEAIHLARARRCPADELFARQVHGIIRRGDTLVAVSTSGRSPKVLRALDQAACIGCTRMGFTGSRNADFARRCEWVLPVPSASTPRIQEVHLLLGHSFCAMIENALVPLAVSEEVLP